MHVTKLLFKLALVSNLLNSIFINAFADTTDQKNHKQPNVILILTDDQPYGYLGVTGNPTVKTPNIDKMANEGVLFTNAHVGTAICTPSRASILLGQYERKHGINFNSGTSVSDEAWENSYPMLFRKAGYYTGWVGKNHVPVGRGGYESGLMEKSFDYWLAGHGHLGFYPKERNSIFSETHSDTQVEIIGESINDFLNDNEYKFKKAVTFLDKRPTDKPFMLSINFNLPHSASTRTMKQKETDDEIYKSLYRDQLILLPEFYTAKKDIKKPKLPSDLLKTAERQTGYDYVDKPDTMKEIYIRQIQSMTGIDRMVGQLRQKLNQLNLADNTIIVFTSDHGLYMGEHGLGGKALCYEKTTHVPLIIYDPRQPRKIQTSSSLVQTIDIAPTILAMAGLESPKTIQGEDITPILTGEKQNTNRDYAYSENLWSTQFGNPRCESVQDNEWKYIRYYKNNTFPASEKIKTAKLLNIPQNKMLYAVHDPDIAIYREYAEAGLKGEPAVYEELYHLANDPEEINNLMCSQAEQGEYCDFSKSPVASSEQFKTKLMQMRKAWKSSLTFARGKGTPAVYRYTDDSIFEHVKKAH